MHASTIFLYNIIMQNEYKFQEILRKNNVTITGNETARHTMVFVHGFGNDQTAWHKILPAFSADYRIVLIDNMGASKANRADFKANRYQQLEKYADDLLDVCDTLHLEDAVLVGHSAGAMISVLSAVRAPEYFSKLVLIGASPRYLNDGSYYGGFTNADIRDIYAAIQQDHWKWAAGFSEMAMQNPEKPDLAAHFANTIRDIPTDQVLTVLQSILQSDYRNSVSKLKLPTLIIQSRNDPFVPMEVAQYLHEQIEGSRLKVVHAFGHLPHISAPEEIVAAISGFIR